MSEVWRELVWLAAMLSGVLVLVCYGSVSVCMTIYLAASGEILRASLGLTASVVTIPTFLWLLSVQLDRLTAWQLKAHR